MFGVGILMLLMNVWWNIEDCGFDVCDYVWFEVNDGFGMWVSVFGLVMYVDEGNGIDGV